jgi:hypothetical protein
MRNKLSFCNMAFLMLLIGKIGHIGTLDAIGWVIVFIPFLLDLLLDFVTEMGYIRQAIGWYNMKKKVKELNNIANREKKNT